MLSCARITIVPSLVEVGIAHTNDSKPRLLKGIALMLTHLHLKGFKSWRDTGDIDLRPITGLFGTNSSGKTSVLQALLLLKQTAESPDRATVFNFGSEKTPVDLGSFRDVAHAHDVNNILASTVPGVMRLIMLTLSLFCPLLSIRPIRCSTFIGFHGRS